MSVAALLLLLVVLLATALFTWRWRHFSYFRRIGIPGPKPSLIWGNIMEYHATDHYKVIGRWIKKYGDIFGFYDGDVPFVVTMDLDLIETVNIRHFKNFMSRGLTMMVEKMHPFLGKSIIYVDGCQWKSIRNTLARGFSAAKLKLMMPLLEEDVAVLLSLLEEHAKLGEEVNMLRKYEQLAMDFLFRGSFGVDERFQGRPDHPFETIARTAGRKLMTGTLHMVAQTTTCFGPLAKPLSWLSLVLADVDKVIRETAKVIEVRRRDRSYRKPDILQNLLDAEYVEDEKQKENRKSSEIHKSRSLTTAEVITSAVTLFVAGYETTATSLSYLTFVLAKYLDVQEKVRQEIYSVLGTEGKLDFDTLMKKLEYFDQVIYETFRLYPPGLTFAPGNEDQLNNAAFMPFGMGPRNCVGRSLAMLKAKLTLGKLLQRYRLELGPSQMGEMKIASRAMLSTPVSGPWIIFRRLKNP
ncbi:cytochrome P450 3A14-like isoform X2 [Amblyomma americanum]